MLRNYLLITFRSMMKNKPFVIINIIGMGAAIACCIVGYLSGEFNTQFDAVHENGDKLYRVSATVRNIDNSESRFGYSSLPLREVISKTIPDVKYSSPYMDSRSNFKRNADLFPSQLSYVAPDFLQMFSFDFIAGDRTAINDKNTVVLSETMARRLFNEPADAVGKMLTQVMGDQLKELRVGGVFRDPPMNSSFHKPDGVAFINFESYKDEFTPSAELDWKELGTLFIQVDDQSRLGVVSQQLQVYARNNNDLREDFQIKRYELDAFETMAHHDRDQNVRAQTAPAPPLSAVVGSQVMAGLLLLIACFNLTNTAIAISSRRLKEIGLRKVMGSMRRQLVIQFIGETTFVCLLAIIFAIGVSDYMAEGWNLLTGNKIHIETHYIDNPQLLFFLSGLMIVTGLLAGSYPAFYISRFEPVTILKGTVKFGGTNYFTRILLGMQFALSLISIVSAFAFLQNAQYQREYDLGFDIYGSVIVSVNNGREYEVYSNAVEGNANVISVAGAKSSIGSFRMHEAVRFESKEKEVDVIEVGDNYLSSLNLKLTSGRDFRSESETDVRESVIITDDMAKQFGITDPLGKEFIWRDSIHVFVVGTIRDIYTQGLWRERSPMMIRYVPKSDYTHVIVNTSAASLASVNEEMRSDWAQVFPNRLYPGRMLAVDMDAVDRLGMSIVYGYAMMGMMAMILSVSGLFSLVSLNIVRRTKEIGIRRVLGASAFNIARIINTEFVIILLIASVIGSWAGYLWSNTIMSSIWRYYQTVTVSSFMMAVVLLLSVAGLTIGWRAYAAATVNPVDTLRDD